jgi:hypothetical protein
VEKCKSYSKSQIYKDAEHHIMNAEARGEGNPASIEDMMDEGSVTPPTSDKSDMWCCIKHILTL